MENGKIVNCPYCKSALFRDALYQNDCICTECRSFIDIDEEWRNSMTEIENPTDWWEEYYMSNLTDLDDDENLEDDKKSQKIEEEKEEEVLTLQLSFLTQISFNELKVLTNSLGGIVEFMALETKGLIKQYCSTDPGKKLARGLKLDTEAGGVDEYKATMSFFVEGAEDRLSIISTLCRSFPLVLIREEGSKYIMANNKGLAKGMSDMFPFDTELLSEFITATEKFAILKDYLYWVDPYKTKAAKDIYIKWANNSLVSLGELRKQSSLLPEWADYLSENYEIQVSVNAKDSGEWLTFDEMIEKVHARIISLATYKQKTSEPEAIVEVVSLRGFGNLASKEV